jgi:hypothetical protein
MPCDLDLDLGQIEYTNRLGYSWQLQFHAETEEMKLTAGLNKVLLENILPAHVAAYFLQGARKNNVSGLPSSSSSLLPANAQF